MKFQNLMQGLFQSDVESTNENLINKEANSIRLYFGIGSFRSISFKEIVKIVGITSERLMLIK
ncbi:hypothetical protein BTO04_02545 [Polaribacter sp. SA4-10]|uniref:hypothetical protein n=1 Tax=Polaribacter sp. SA4-10 TaxID=754397 RepID=UPI000B3C5AF8|nr:hypothetical protein [Polaribacter sp. SA4-10]ARV05641.1 hypothetical protein BTO04_02545 [Polaribacter sp. SA4-10]